MADEPSCPVARLVGIGHISWPSRHGLAHKELSQCHQTEGLLTLVFPHACLLWPQWPAWAPGRSFPELTQVTDSEENSPLVADDVGFGWVNLCGLVS